MLGDRDRADWLASLDRASPVLLEFGRAVDDLCRHALEQTGRELPAAHAAIVLLRAAAEDEPA